MKKLLVILATVGFVLTTQAAVLRSDSFLADTVVSVLLTNAATPGLTNLNSINQNLNDGASGTNYYLLMYTNGPQVAVGGTNLPGILYIDVRTNINFSQVGTMGLPPYSVTNMCLVKSNDTFNILKDVMFPTGVRPGLGLVGGPGTTNLPYAATIEVQFTANQLTGSANGSNYVSFVFSPLATDGTEILNNGGTPGAANGVLPSLTPWTVTLTNAASVTAIQTFLVPVPSQLFVGAAGVRCRSATPGSAWTTGGALWLTRLRLNYWTD